MYRVIIFAFSIGVATLTASGCATGGGGIAPQVVKEDAHTSGTVLAFSPDGEVLASGGADGRLRLWRSRDGAELGGWSAHGDDPVTGIAFTGPQELITGGLDGSLARWKVDGTLLRRVAGGTAIQALAVRDQDLVTGHRDGSVVRWKLADMGIETSRRLHDGAVRSVALGGDGQVASGGRDGDVYLWHRNATPIRLPRPSYDAYDLEFSPDGNTLMGSAFFRLLRWDLDPVRLQELPTEHHGIIKAIEFTGDGRELASISRQTDKAVYFLDPANGLVTRRFQAHELCGEDVRLSANGRYLATTSDDASVRIWHLGRARAP